MLKRSYKNFYRIQKEIKQFQLKELQLKRLQITWFNNSTVSPSETERNELTEKILCLQADLLTLEIGELLGDPPKDFLCTRAYNYVSSPDTDKYLQDNHPAAKNFFESILCRVRRALNSLRLESPLIAIMIFVLHSYSPIR